MRVTVTFNLDVAQNQSDIRHPIGLLEVLPKKGSHRIERLPLIQLHRTTRSLGPARQSARTPLAPQRTLTRTTRTRSNQPMPVTHIALLRGINVGGHNKLPMADLRDLFDQLGHTNVATYVQSGNIVFTSETSDEPTLIRGITTAIHDRFAYNVPTIVRTTGELATVASHHPYRAAEPDDAKLHVIFLDEAPPSEAIPALDPARFTPDEFTLEGRHLYVVYPNGQGRSKLTIDAVERAYGVTATARNWRTVTRLLELATTKA